MTPVEMIIELNTKKDAVDALIESGYCTSRNYAKKLYHKYKVIKRGRKKNGTV